MTVLALVQQNDAPDTHTEESNREELAQTYRAARERWQHLEAEFDTLIKQALPHLAGSTPPSYRLTRSETATLHTVLCAIKDDFYLLGTPTIRECLTIFAELRGVPPLSRHLPFLP